MKVFLLILKFDNQIMLISAKINTPNTISRLQCVAQIEFTHGSHLPSNLIQFTSIRLATISFLGTKFQQLIQRMYSTDDIAVRHKRRQVSFYWPPFIGNSLHTHTHTHMRCIICAHLRAAPPSMLYTSIYTHTYAFAAM